MKIKNISGLEDRIKSSEDAEVLGEAHYALDIYDFDPMLTLEIEFTPKGVRVDAAARLEYSEEMKGYYMGERVDDTALVERALMEWLAQGE